VLLRLAYPAVTNPFAALRLLPVDDRDKDVEILRCGISSASWSDSSALTG
jgi:hypothetical protein